jgi:hypothetical protein
MSLDYTHFNTKLCEVLGLDVTKVASLMIVATGEETTINVEWVALDDHGELDNWHQKYRIVPLDPHDARGVYDRGVIADE